MSFYYLASPYSRHPRGFDAAAREAAEAAAICLKAGIMVVSPIAHSHAVNAIMQGPTDAATWAKLNDAIIEASAGIIVVKMDGWETSDGIAAEIKLAGSLRLPVFYMKPDGPASFHW